MLVIDSRNVRIESLPTVVGLPLDAYVEYFGKLPDGRDFIIVRPRQKWEYEDFCLLVDGEVIPISSVVRYRDGGTTDIVSAIGKFHFPTRFNMENKPTLDGMEITVYERLA